MRPLYPFGVAIQNPEDAVVLPPQQAPAFRRQSIVEAVVISVAVSVLSTLILRTFFKVR